MSIRSIPLVLILVLLLAGCAAKGKHNTDIKPPLTSIHQIDSFNIDVASAQALEVVNNNPYEQDFFEKVFARLVEQSRNSKSRENADVIWEEFVTPLKQSGKVPPDLAIATWNYYFSRNFVSLPAMGEVTQSCYRLSEIKKNLEKEYQLKRAGFEVTEQGSPDKHFLNAMYVYNTMWAACHEAN